MKNSCDVLVFADDNLLVTVRNLIGKQTGDILRVEVEPLRELVAQTRAIVHLGGLEQLTHLESVSLGNNRIVHIDAIQSLTNLQFLDLSFNQITDLTALVDNTGLGDGDKVLLTGNPLSDQAIEEQIPLLRARGVEVEFDTRSSAPPSGEEITVELQPVGRTVKRGRTKAHTRQHTRRADTQMA